MVDFCTEIGLDSLFHQLNGFCHRMRKTITVHPLLYDVVSKERRKRIQDGNVTVAKGSGNPDQIKPVSEAAVHGVCDKPKVLFVCLMSGLAYWPFKTTTCCCEYCKGITPPLKCECSECLIHLIHG